ncbi:hypothetical protein [Microbacterium sp. HSID17254]|nr:hypothetical protein [Microbacterium sp. HSID17254]
MNHTEEQIEALNRAFGSRTGGAPRFTAEDEGDDYLFGRPTVTEQGENR